jgi:glycosyltransferase involved in cell wall biosynthesis
LKARGSRPQSQAPAVTVGIPTYNRADSLARALDSAVAQSERDIEVLVSDDASTDHTPELIAELAGRDPRVRHLRQQRNLGLTANFNAVLREARGHYVMLLADDDWIDEGYVARCRAALDADARLALACGNAVYHEAGGHTFPGRDINLYDSDPRRRVRRYFGLVTDNVCIYGLMRRSLLERALPMRNCLAGDWLLIARLAFQGMVRTEPATHVHRSTGGTSANFDRTVSRMGLSEFEARHPHLAIMRFIRDDIARDSPVYDSLPLRSRRVLGTLSAAQIARTRPMGLIIEELLSRPPLRAPYRRLARRRAARTR